MLSHPRTSLLALCCCALLLPVGFGAAPAAAQVCTGWQYFPAPRPLDDGDLRGVAGFASDDVWAVGSYRTFAHSGRLSLAVHWDGQTWTQVPTPNPGVYPDSGTKVYLDAVGGVAPDDVWALGTYYTNHDAGGGWVGFQTLALHWDGATWDQVATPHTPAGGTGAALFGLDPVATDDVWAVGVRVGSDLVGVTEVGLVLHWDGGQWSELPTPPVVSVAQELYAVKVFAADDVWAVGGHTGGQYGPLDEPYVVHWDGGAWTLDTTVPYVGDATFIKDMVALAPDNIWLVGYTQEDGRNKPLLLHQNGNGWQRILPTGFDHPFGQLRAVAARAPDDIWAVGAYTIEPPPAIGYKLIMHWDGSTWTQVSADPAGPLDGTLWGIATIPGDNLWTVGGDSAVDNPTERLCSGSFPLFADGFELGIDLWSAAQGMAP